MKKIEVIRKGNTRNLLTVAPDRITVKIGDGQTAEQELHAQSFLMKVALRIDDSHQYTLRGTLTEHNGELQISMKSGSFSRRFKESEFQ